jgi:glycyl-radical enzyme activating protein
LKSFPELFIDTAMPEPLGIVFDIQRCALNDGPGIRTAVFLKGCRLHCLWCHNPESRKADPEPFFTRRKCAYCGLCQAVCPNRCHEVGDAGHVIDWKPCSVCGQCVAACPHRALEIKGAAMTVESVLKIVLADLPYYKNSGGGATLSGGEPLVQFGFTRALLSQCKKEGIHTCLETCGYVPEAALMEVLPLVDLFLYDYKATGPDHQRLTGVDNQRILSNLERLLDAGGAVILRCPLIPGVNDTDEHLAAIARMERRYPSLRGIEILPYHNFGSLKSEALGEKPAMEFLPNAAEEQKIAWLKKLRRHGSKKARLL